MTTSQGRAEGVDARAALVLDYWFTPDWPTASALRANPEQLATWFQGGARVDEVRSTIVIVPGSRGDASRVVWFQRPWRRAPWPHAGDPRAVPGPAPALCHHRARRVAPPPRQRARGRYCDGPVLPARLPRQARGACSCAPASRPGSTPQAPKACACLHSAAGLLRPCFARCLQMYALDAKALAWAKHILVRGK